MTGEWVFVVEWMLQWAGVIWFCGIVTLVLVAGGAFLLWKEIKLIKRMGR